MRRRDLLGLAASGALGPAYGRKDAGTRADAVVLDYEQATGGHVGVYAEDIATGRRWAWRADDRFVMCSTFKASLAACVLARVDQGRDSLAQMIHYGPADLQDWHAPVAAANLATGALSVGAMCQAAVEQSDNTCANLLLARIGGPQALTEFWRRSLNDRHTRLDDREPELNRTPPGGVRNTTTPRAMAGILSRLVLSPVLAESSRRVLTDWLVGCRTGANRLRAGLPPGWRIGDKTGNNGRDAAGDIAIVWPVPARPVVISVYTRGGEPTPGQLEEVFAGIGRIVGRRLAPL